MMFLSFKSRFLSNNPFQVVSSILCPIVALFFTRLDIVAVAVEQGVSSDLPNVSID